MDTYLHPSSKTALVSKCEHVLIRSHIAPLQEEFQTLLDKDKIDDLARMYGLLSRIPDGLESLRTVFETHVCKQGLLSVEKVVPPAFILLTTNSGPRGVCCSK